VRLNYDYALRRHVEFLVNIQGHIKLINLDAKRMKQILMNLISNAVKYSRAGSSVTIDAKVINHALEISVIDQGFGMNEEQLKIAFTKYGTIANENSRHVDSLGLGLPITKQLIEVQNGTLEVKSEIGKGTEMKMRFPYLM
jgi:signal transduction histidine kinase